MFHNDEGWGQDKIWRARPKRLSRGCERGRRHHHEDEGSSFGPAHVHGGRSRFGLAGGFGPGGFGPRGFGFGPGRRAMVRRGDVRTAILVVLAEEPMHGYQIIQKLGDRSGGMWQPSAGSVYPTLQQLEDEGLVHGEERDGRRVYTLTDDGKKAAEEAASNPAPWEAPWKTAAFNEAAGLFGLLLPLGNAVAQVSRVGDPETIGKARVILTDARRALYRLLAEEGGSATSATSPTEPTE